MRITHVELISSAFKLYRLILCRCFHFFFPMNLVRFNSITICLPHFYLTQKRTHTHTHIQNSRNPLHLLYIYLFVLSFVSCCVLCVFVWRIILILPSSRRLDLCGCKRKVFRKEHTEREYKRKDEISVCACHRRRRYPTRPKNAPMRVHECIFMRVCVCVSIYLWNANNKGHIKHAQVLRTHK